MSDYQRRIEERQAVSDAYDRGEISLEEMLAQLDDVPLVPAPRPAGDTNGPWGGLSTGLPWGTRG